MAYEHFNEYKEQRALTNWVRVLHVVLIAMTGIGIWATILELDLLQRLTNGGGFSSTAELQEILDKNDARVRWTTMASLGMWIVTWIFCFVWIYRMTRNARAISAAPMDVSPGMAVGWFFVPFINLFMPYISLREVVRASSPLGDASDGPLAIFWFFFAARLVDVAITRYLDRSATEIPDFILIDQLAMVGHAATILCSIFFIALTWSLTAKQRKRYVEADLHRQPSQG